MYIDFSHISRGDCALRRLTRGNALSSPCRSMRRFFVSDLPTFKRTWNEVKKRSSACFSCSFIKEKKIRRRGNVRRNKISKKERIVSRSFNVRFRWCDLLCGSIRFFGGEKNRKKERENGKCENKFVCSRQCYCRENYSDKAIWFVWFKIRSVFVTEIKNKTWNNSFIRSREEFLPRF